jgi:hypothetical protein
MNSIGSGRIYPSSGGRLMCSCPIVSKNPFANLKSSLRYALRHCLESYPDHMDDVSVHLGRELTQATKMLTLRLEVVSLFHCPELARNFMATRWIRAKFIHSGSLALITQRYAHVSLLSACRSKKLACFAILTRISSVTRLFHGHSFILWLPEGDWTLLRTSAVVIKHSVT